MAKKERVIVWRVTQSCDLKCKFCSYSRDVERQRDDADSELIRSFSEVLGEYRKQTGDEVLVSWIGGEPFLRSDLLEHSERLHGLGIKVSATTNGVPLTEEKLRRIDGCFSEIVFSLDSFKECDDEVRGFDGHFDMVCGRIRELDKIRRSSGSGLKIKVNTILMRRNIADFERFCELLQSLGVDEVTFNRLGGYDRPEFFGDNRLLFEQSRDFAEKLPSLKRRFAEKGLVIHGSEKYMERFMYAALDKPMPVEECDPGAWFWFVNENGYISPCSYTSYEYKFPLRDIKCAADFDRAEQYFREQRRCARSKWCDDCFCTQVYDKFE
ncbi:MAG: radical SAM protein [Oscillospiraceae bacterium]